MCPPPPKQINRYRLLFFFFFFLHSRFSSLIVCTGCHGYNIYLNDVVCLDLKQTPSQWFMPMIQGLPPCPRAWHSGTRIGEYKAVFGGTSG